MLDIRETTLETYSTVQSLKGLQDDEKKREMISEPTCILRL